MLQPSAASKGDALDGIVIRRVSTLAEYDECVRIERETWGDEFREAVPARLMHVTQEIGGVTAAAFDRAGRMLGFVFGMTGVRNGEPAHWSDMLAVRHDARDLGLGTRLKLFQRDELRTAGVRTMYWTYDPLVARNAYLNIERLGAIPMEYHADYYGPDTGSVLHGGLGTDRFIVAWDLERESPPTSPAAREAEGGPVVNSPDEQSLPRMGELPREPYVRVAIPRDIFAVMAQSIDVAHAWRDTTRRAFEWYLGQGYRVLAFRRDEPHGASYVLSRD